MMKALVVVVAAVSLTNLGCGAPASMPSVEAQRDAILRGISRSALSFFAATVTSMEVAGPHCESAVAGVAVQTARLRLTSACGIRDDDNVVPCGAALTVTLNPDRPVSSSGNPEAGVAFFQPFPFENGCGASFTLVDLHTPAFELSMDDLVGAVESVEARVTPMRADEIWSNDEVVDDE